MCDKTASESNVLMFIPFSGLLHHPEHTCSEFALEIGLLQTIFVIFNFFDKNQHFVSLNCVMTRNCCKINIHGYAYLFIKYKIK